MTTLNASQMDEISQQRRVTPEETAAYHRYLDQYYGYDLPESLRQKAYRLAYQDSHSEGYGAVEATYMVLIKLVRAGFEAGVAHGQRDR